MWNVLQSTPQLLTSGDKLTVKGETPIIFINDKKVYLTATELQQLLETTPATHIKSVEVITNPPAKYDAEGGAVINIVMSKNLATGIMAVLTDKLPTEKRRSTLWEVVIFIKRVKLIFILIIHTAQERIYILMVKISDFLIREIKLVIGNLK